MSLTNPHAAGYTADAGVTLLKRIPPQIETASKKSIIYVVAAIAG
jgi:hypothetical protein